MTDSLFDARPRLLDLFCGAGGCTKGYQPTMTDSGHQIALGLLEGPPIS